MPETRSEDYQEIQGHTVSVSLNFISINGKNRSLKARYTICNESAITLERGRPVVGCFAQFCDSNANYNTIIGSRERTLIHFGGREIDLSLLAKNWAPLVNKD